MRCWFKRDLTAKWEEGIFHQWSTNGSFPAAIVEAIWNGECFVVYAGHVSFSHTNPDLPKKTKRFEPRLVIVPEISSNTLLFQVHPETIEVFSDDKYLCQIRWIGGKMDYNQGGLPIKELIDMFKKVNQ